MKLFSQLSAEMDNSLLMLCIVPLFKNFDLDHVSAPSLAADTAMQLL